MITDDVAAPPLLFVDVDGPLNPHERSIKSARKGGYIRRGIDGFVVLLNLGHGASLSSLPVELVWGTTWGHKANREIGPRIGLPDLPVCDFPDADTGTTSSGLHFKTPFVVEYADGRPFAWIDDEITDVDRAWVEEHHGGEALLHWVDPSIGLQQSDFDTLAVWARSQVCDLE